MSIFKNLWFQKIKSIVLVHKNDFPTPNPIAFFWKKILCDVGDDILQNSIAIVKL